MVEKKHKKFYVPYLLVILVLVLLLNIVSGFFYFRIDLTSEKRFSLTETSKAILAGLDDYLYIQVYLEGDLPAGFARLQKEVIHILNEFRAYAPRYLDYDLINPLEDPDPEVRNRIISQLFDKGLQPTRIQVIEENGESSRNIIPGAVIHYQDLEFPVNFLKNNPNLPWEVNLNHSIETLEYEFMNMIRNITADTIVKVAFLEGQGELDQYEVGDITKELSYFYQIDRGKINSRAGILDDYAAVIIAKPVQAFREVDKYVLDQYLMKGGKLVWLIDRTTVNMDSLREGKTFAFARDLNIDDQLFKYGVRINPDILKDRQSHKITLELYEAGSRQPEPTPVPWLYYPLMMPSRDHPVTRNINLVRGEYVSSLDTVGTSGEVKKTVLLTSSPYSRKIRVPALIDLGEYRAKVEPEQYRQSHIPTAVLLEGRFESVFTNRAVPAGLSEKPGERKYRSVPTELAVIGDGDIIRNEVSLTGRGPVIQRLGYDPYTGNIFGNGDFLLNLVNYLTGNKGLMEMRSRNIQLRLLDKAKVRNQKARWQMVNILVPVGVVFLSGSVYLLIRRRKYTKSMWSS